MQKDCLSSKQLICMMILFAFGSTAIMGISSDVGQDTWIAMIISCMFSIPFILIYSRILHLFPNKDFYDIIEILVGKVGSKIFIILMTWYTIHLGGLVMCNFHEFIALVDLPNTPHFVVILPVLVLTIYLAKSSMSTFGNWSIINLAVISIVVLITIVFSIKDADFNNLLPVFNHGIGKMSLSSIKIFAFPLGETVLFLGIFGNAKSNTSPYKVYVIGILLASLILLLIILRNIITLGTNMISAEYFPSYSTSRIISIGKFLSRIEGTISLNFLLAGITKITVCILAASNGLVKLFGIKDPKKLIVPSCVLMLAVCFTSFTNIMEMFTFASDYYYIYAILFQMIIPIVIWIIAEFKTHMGKIKLAGIDLPLSN